MKRNFGAQR